MKLHYTKQYIISKHIKKGNFNCGQTASELYRSGQLGSDANYRLVVSTHPSVLICHAGNGHLTDMGLRCERHVHSSIISVSHSQHSDDGCVTVSTFIYFFYPVNQSVYVCVSAAELHLV